MRGLEKKLKNWLAQGLVSQQQVEKNRDYEGAKSNWILYGLLILGLSTISVGVVSIIAANWHLFPNSLKLISNFFILGVMGALAFYGRKERSSLFFEVSLFFFPLLCLASIGLISQIYNTGGDISDAFLLWSLITLGLFFLSERRPLPLV